MKQIIGKIKEGAVFVVLTDTIYGLSCVFDNKESLRRIKAMKKIESDRSFVVLLSDFKMLKKYFKVSKKQEQYILSKSSTPTSFILNLKDPFISSLSFESKEGVAVRLPKVEFLTKMINEINKPIVSTSCNITGSNFLNKERSIKEFFKNKEDRPEFFIKAKNQRPKRKSSAIIDIRDIDNVKIIRD